MKTSEITVEYVKNYLRVDNTADDLLLEAITAASVDFVKNYTNLTIEELDDYPDIPLAVLAICGDMYDVRQWTIQTTSINPLAKQILDSHAMNYLEGMKEG